METDAPGKSHDAPQNGIEKPRLDRMAAVPCPSVAASIGNQYKRKGRRQSSAIPDGYQSRHNQYFSFQAKINKFFRNQ
jgi:hypothetical protein